MFHRGTYTTPPVVTGILGLLLVIGAAGEWLARLLCARAHRTTRVHDVLVVTGVFAALTGAPGPGSVAPAVAAAAAAALWFAGTRGGLRLSPSGEATLAAGAALPAFEGRRADGGVVTDRDVVAAAPAVVVLYRGGWCPFCRTQLGELQAAHDRLRAAGLTLFAITTEPPEELARLQARLGERVTLLSLSDGRFLDAAGARDRRGPSWYDRLLLGARGGALFRPATLLVGADGRVRWIHRAERIDDRPTVDQILTRCADALA